MLSTVYHPWHHSVCVWCPTSPKEKRERTTLKKHSCNYWRYSWRKLTKHTAGCICTNNCAIHKRRGQCKEHMTQLVKNWTYMYEQFPATNAAIIFYYFFLFSYNMYRNIIVLSYVPNFKLSSSKAFKFNLVLLNFV